MPVASVPDTTLPMEIRYTVCTGNEKDLRPHKKIYICRVVLGA